MLKYPQMLLEHVKRHIPLTQEEEQYFLSILEEKQLRKKEFLLRAGEVSRTENYVAKGLLRVYSIDADGVEHIVQFGMEDWWVGDLASFFSQTPANYFIDALEDGVLLQITKPKLDLLYEQVPKFERFFRILLQNAFVAMQRRITQNLSATAEERYQEFMQKYPGLDQRLSQKQIASYLGITPEFLSMLRRKRAGR